MLYTIISEYDIFVTDFSKHQFVDVGCGKIEYEIKGKNKIIKSIFSTDPKMFLDKRYSPGQILDI